MTVYQLRGARTAAAQKLMAEYFMGQEDGMYPDTPGWAPRQRRTRGASAARTQSNTGGDTGSTSPVPAARRSSCRQRS